MRNILLFLFLITVVLTYGQSSDAIDVSTGEMTFNVRLSGDPQDPPVILLHGFPETSFMWRELQNLLREEGYFSIAPDQRGYSPGARPGGRKSYAIDLLAQDVLDLAGALGVDRFHLVGHDWGSAVGWYLAARHPERIISWTALSVPHLSSFSRAIVNDDDQKKASTYMRQFQWPLIPELILKAGDYKNLITIWDQSSQEEVDAYLKVFSQKGAVTSALNWYRANYRTLLEYENLSEQIVTPTLFIWGKNDSAILESAVVNNRQYVSGEYEELFLHSGHWLMQESFDEVSQAILRMLDRNN